jgi:carbonic anhydrase
MPCSPPPARLAIVTCMDPRIQLPRVLGDEADTFVLRNAGGRVTDDVLRSLALCTLLLEVTRVGVLHHTDCRLQEFTNEELAIRTGLDIDFMSCPNPVTSILEDIDRLSSCDMLSAQVEFWGGLYDVEDHAIRVITGSPRSRQKRSRANSEAAIESGRRPLGDEPPS